MRLAFIASNRTNSTGGSEALWTKTAIRALKQGDEVACLVYDWKKPHPLLNEIQKAGGVIFYRKLRGKHRGILSRAYLKLSYILKSRVLGEDYELNELARWKPDVICLSQGADYDHAFHNTYLSFLNKYPIPFAILFHSYRDEGLINSTLRKKSNDVLSKTSMAYFVADRQRAVIEKQLRIKLEKSRIVFNPLNLDSYEIIPFPESNELRMAMISSLETRWKGHDILFESLAGSEWKNRTWRLEIYGNGKDKPELLEMAKFYGIENNVHFNGYESNIKKVWSQNQLLVMPSRIEAAPLTVAEAMICGRPVLTTDIGDMASYFEDGVSGFLACAPNKKYLNIALERLWNNQDRLEEMGKQAHHQAMAQFPLNADELYLNELRELAEKD